MKKYSIFNELTFKSTQSQIKTTTAKTTTPSPSPSGNLITQTQFNNALTSNGYAQPSATQYKNLVSLAKSAGGITTSQQLAMFLSQIMWESAGLTALRELFCYPVEQSAACAYSSGVGSDGQSYFGRGYIQLVMLIHSTRF